MPLDIDFVSNFLGSDHNYVLGFFAACPCWLTAALDTLDSNFGSSAEYAANAAGVGKEEVDRFIMICIEDNR